MTDQEVLARKTAEAEEIIYRFLPKEEGHAKTLLSASNYSVTVGGKRLRPIIMRETYELLGGNGPEIDYFMAAMEMIHSSSLVHDDLPCMDNDEWRRGKRTTWYVYGEAMATLAGDNLFVLPFETAAGAFVVTKDPARVGEALRVLAHKTGQEGMIGGQSVDVELTDSETPLTLEQLEFIYHLKTGALLEASMMVGAILAGADPETVAKTERIASCIGMAFQIRDDILDVISTTDQLGKPVLSDEKNHKTTYVSVYGLERAAEMVEEYSEEGIRLLAEIGGEGSFLESLFRMMISREK